MTMSITHLKAGLEVLDYVTEEVKNLKDTQFKEKQQIRQRFLEKQDLLFKIFNDVF